MTWLGWLIALVTFGFALFVLWALGAILAELKLHLDFHLHETQDLAKLLRPKKDAS